MPDLTPEIETQENRWMRAWVQRDARTLKSLTATDFILLMGSKPPVILDQKSWLDAAARRWSCTSYRFGDIYVRKVGNAALFASQLELTATLDGEDWSGTYWITDLWRKGRIRRGWRMAQRVVSRIDDNARLAPAVRDLQLWKSPARQGSGRIGRDRP
ncbi:MAG TPA: nuclear transport factor 2 family protein [Sphingomicrobium sp.]